MKAGVRLFFFLQVERCPGPGATIAHKRPGHVLPEPGPTTKPALPLTCYV